MHEFVDETFQLETTSEKILSIQAGLNGFSFSIICPLHNKLLYFKSTSQKISTENLLSRHFESWFSAETVLKSSFKSVILFYHSKNITLVPNQLFQNTSKDELTSLLFEGHENLSWINNFEEEIDARILFTIPEAFKQTIKKYLPVAHITHPIKPLLAPDNNLNDGQKLVLQFEANHFTAALTNNEKLQLVNHFSFKHPNDVVYFVLTVLRQFNIAAKNIPMIYGGDLSAHSGLVELLQKHFPNSTEIQPNIPPPPFIEKSLITKNISLFL